MDKQNQPLVGIVMGSDSDLPALKPAALALDELGVAWEMTIVSAHRTPERMYEYSRSARARGLRVIIAGAGGAAHLPGMVAALTDLPVIGVPVRSKTLDGLDSLLSIVQMPGGVPVATVAVDGGRNAGLLAARVLGCSGGPVAEALERLRASMEAEVLAKAAELERSGPASYEPPLKPQAGWAGLSGASSTEPKA